MAKFDHNVPSNAEVGVSSYIPYFCGENGSGYGYAPPRSRSSNNVREYQWRRNEATMEPKNRRIVDYSETQPQALTDYLENSNKIMQQMA